MLGTNTLAYNENLKVTCEKSFMSLTPARRPRLSAAGWPGSISQLKKKLCDKTSCLGWIKFNNEDDFTQDKNITTKLKWKLFTKVIREQSKEAWG